MGGKNEHQTEHFSRHGQLSGGRIGRRRRGAARADDVTSEPDRERRQEPERLADLSRQLQELALQRARPDQRQQRQEPAGRLDALAGPLDARPAVDARSWPTASSTTPAPTAASSRSTAPPARCIWSYIPELDEDLVARQTHSPYNRGIAMGDGNVYVGTVDGRLIALDMKTGKPVWDTKLINSAEADRRLHRRAARS